MVRVLEQAQVLAKVRVLALLRVEVCERVLAAQGQWACVPVRVEPTRVGVPVVLFGRFVPVEALWA